MDKNLIDISYGVTDCAPRGWAAILDHFTVILHSYTAILDSHAAILDRHAADPQSETAILDCHADSYTVIRDYNSDL